MCSREGRRKLFWKASCKIWQYHCQYHWPRSLNIVIVACKLKGEWEVWDGAISCPLFGKQQGQACACHGYWKLMGAVIPHVASKCWSTLDISARTKASYIYCGREAWKTQTAITEYLRYKKFRLLAFYLLRADGNNLLRVVPWATHPLCPEEHTSSRISDF